VPGPPSKPPPSAAGPAKPGLQKQQPPAAEDALARSRREREELEGETQAVEEELEALKAKYDMYFLGVERREPNRWRDDVKKKVMRLKSAFTRNTGLKFRIQSLHARYLSYERLWLRTAREKEEGTYRRDLFKARLRARGEDEPAEAAKPAKAAARAPARTAAAPASAKPAAGTTPPAPSSAPAAGAASVSASPSGISDTQMRALYDAYVAAKVRCREDVSKLTYDAVARSVSKQIPELVTRYKARSVEFKVEVKDGKAVLKAVPKV
jgi:hypothetical protein